MCDYDLEDSIEEVIDEICSILPWGEGDVLTPKEVRDYTVAIQNLVGSLLTLSEVSRLRFWLDEQIRRETCDDAACKCDGFVGCADVAAEVCESAGGTVEVEFVPPSVSRGVLDPELVAAFNEAVAASGAYEASASAPDEAEKPFVGEE